MIFNKIFLKNFKISILLNKNYLYLYIYNNNYYSLLKLKRKLNVKIINNDTIELKNNSNIATNINSFIKQFYFYEFTKIKFTGKGYKIKKNTNKSIVLLFNRAHTTIVWWKNIFIKKLKKYKMYVKYGYKQKNIVNTILSTRQINIFTKKGLRKSRQILFKKKGKK